VTKEKNRFSALSSLDESKNSKPQLVRGEAALPEERTKRATMDIPLSKHRQLKLIALQQDRSIKDLLAESLEMLLEKYPPPSIL
jgi:hypothetical protein